jgi:hypothetical protein
LPLLSILFTLLFFVVLGLTMTRSLPDNKDTALLLGGMIAAFTTMTNYWFTHVRRPSDSPGEAPEEKPPPEPEPDDEAHP